MVAQLPGSRVDLGDLPLQPGLSFSGHESDPLFMNGGDGRFADRGYQARTDLPGDGRSSAWVDLDGDGDLDLVVRQLQAPKLVVLRNDSPPTAHWLEIELEGVTSNRMGIGAVVQVCARGRCQVAPLRAGHGFLSQGPPLVHFGLGAAAEVDSVEVRWPRPSQLVQRLEHVAADRKLRIVEGKEGAESVGGPALTLGPADPPALSLATLGPLPGTDGGAAKPLLVNLWAPWCKPCHEEAPILAAHLAACGAKWSAVALSVDAVSDQERADATAQGFTGVIAVATPEQKAILDRALDSPPLPTTLAFDATGRLTGAIVGKVTPAALESIAPCGAAR